MADVATKSGMHVVGFLVFALTAFTAVLHFERAAQPLSADRQRRRLISRHHDPKTVVSKDTFHERNVNLNSLRYVAFGTSKTWGADLKDREHEAYIKHLSPNGVNFGLRATPADYPSLCLYSMIGGSVFDVIILEFSPYSGPMLDDFTRLIKRLRERFPDAIIIFLPMYMPLMDVQYKKRAIFDYILTQQIKTPKDPRFEELIRDLEDSDLVFPPQSYALKEYFEAVRAQDGHVVEFPVFTGDVKQFILENLNYFGSDAKPWDFIHPSALGHMMIAATIRDKLVEIYSQPRPILSNGVGRWLGGQDRCISWFPNGNITSEIRELRHMEMVNFMESDGKWALEVGKHGGTFNLLCPFDHCNVYISYMAKGPEREYPRVTVTINGMHPTLIDPLLGNFHLRQIAHVGTADHHGVVTVSVKPLREDENVLHDFRITGVIRTPTVH